MAFITVAGETQIAAKQGAAQVLNITHFVLANIAGLGAEPANRIEAMPAAGNIMATLPVTSSGYVNGNQVVYSLVMDSSLGDYDFNWVGLKDADGVLIACTYTPLIQKRKTTGAIPGNNLTRNFLIAFSGIQATAAIAVPAATWQIDFNARLHGIDERERLSNYDIYGHEGFFGDGWKVTRQGATTTYDVAAGIGYVGGVRIASAVTQQVTVEGPPKSVWLDVSLQGDISDVSAVVSFTIDAVAHADYTDANGFKHYVTKIADIAADGSVTDVRVSADNIVPQAEAEAGAATTIRNWTSQRVRQAITAVTSLLAPLASPVFTGNPTAPTPAQFDSDTSVATTAFAMRIGLKAGPTLQVISSSTTLAASTAGSHVISNLGSGAVNVALPFLSSVPVGSAFIIEHNSSNMSSFAINAQGSDTLQLPGNTANIAPYLMTTGEVTIVVSTGSVWKIITSNAAAFLKNTGLFGSTLADTGLQKLPSNLLFKWGTVTASATPGAAQAITFPIAFPNACNAIILVGVTINTSNAAVWYETKTASGFNLRAALGNQNATYLAIGY